MAPPPPPPPPWLPWPGTSPGKGAGTAAVTSPPAVLTCSTKSTGTHDGRGTDAALVAPPPAVPSARPTGTFARERAKSRGMLSQHRA
eukprot:536633-Pleurochrysis_carterae.AAC.2